MVENLTSLGVTPNEIDSDIGEDSEEDEEDDELGHIIIVNEKSEIFKISDFFDVDSILMDFCLVPIARPDVNVGANHTKSAQAGLIISAIKISNYQ